MTERKDVHENGRVGLRTAYEWTCEDCGRDNFERAVIAEITPEERREIAEFEGVPVERLCCELVSYPEQVTCQHCGAQFETENGDAEFEE